MLLRPAFHLAPIGCQEIHPFEWWDLMGQKNPWCFTMAVPRRKLHLEVGASEMTTTWELTDIPSGKLT